MTFRSYCPRGSCRSMQTFMEERSVDYPLFREVRATCANCGGGKTCARALLKPKVALR